MGGGSNSKASLIVHPAFVSLLYTNLYGTSKSSHATLMLRYSISLTVIGEPEGNSPPLVRLYPLGARVPCAAITAIYFSMSSLIEYATSICFVEKLSAPYLIMPARKPVGFLLFMAK